MFFVRRFTAHNRTRHNKNRDGIRQLALYRESQTHFDEKIYPFAIQSSTVAAVVRAPPRHRFRVLQKK
jgi:hypothetical protein